MRSQVSTYKTIFIDSFKRLYITLHEADEGHRRESGVNTGSE